LTVTDFPGVFIVFEGGEGSGKTTQIDLTKQWLMGQVDGTTRLSKFGFDRLLVTREPGDTDLGGHLRSIILDRGYEICPKAELMLYAADRAQHVEAVLRPALLQGCLVLCDRYTASTMAYQGYGRGLPLPMVAGLNKMATGGLEPDCTLWLDVPPVVGLERAKKREKLDRIEQADLTFHESVRQGFFELSQGDPSFIQIDGYYHFDLVQAAVQYQLKQILSAV
jgi:dTMP kinase